MVTQQIESSGEMQINNEVSPLQTDVAALRSRMLKAALSAGQLENSGNKRLDVFPVSEKSSALIEAASKGKDVQVVYAKGNEGPNALANIVANALAGQQQVLIVSNDPNILSRTHLALMHAGLRDHTIHLKADANYNSLISEFRRTILLGEPKAVDPKAKNSNLILNAKNTLDEHARALSEVASEIGFSNYEFYAKLLVLGQNKYSSYNIPNSIIENWSRSDLEKAMIFAKEAESFFSKYGRHSSRDLLAMSSSTLGSGEIEQLTLQTKNAFSKAEEVVRRSNQLMKDLGLSASVSEDNLNAALQSLSVIDELYSDDGKLIQSIDIKDSRWAKNGQELVKGLKLSLDLAKSLEVHQNGIDLDRLEACDLDELEVCIKRYASKSAFGRFFEVEGYNGLSEAILIAKSPNASAEEILAIIPEWKKIKAIFLETQKNNSLLNALFGSLLDEWDARPDNLRAWLKLLPFGESLVEIASVCSQCPDKNKLFDHLSAPKRVYELSEQIKSTKMALFSYKQEREKLCNILSLDAEDQQNLFFTRSLSTQLEMLASDKGEVKWDISAIDTYRELLRKARAPGYQCILQAAADVKNHEAGLVSALEHAWYKMVSERSKEEDSEVVSAFGVMDQMRSSYLNAMKDMCANHASKLAERHYNVLPNLDCGGRAAHFTSLLDGSSEVESAAAVLNQAIDILPRVKPVLVVDPEALNSLSEDLKSKFPLVIIDGGLSIDSLSALSELGVKAKQLVLIGRENKIPLAAKISQFEDSFAECVGNALSESGFVVRKNQLIGAEFVELLVYKDAACSEIMAAIRTDGPRYYGNESTYEREFLADHKVESEGVPVVRVWVKEWAENYTKASQQLLHRLRSISELEAAKSNALITCQYHNSIERSDSKAELGSVSVPYQVAKLDYDECIRHYNDIDISSDLPFWKECVRQVVEAEGPIHSDLLRQRLLQACGLSRPGDKFQSMFDKATSDSVIRKVIRMDGSFYTLAKSKNLIPRDRAGLNESVRIAYIANDEIDATVLTIVRRSCGIKLGDLVTEVRHALGLEGDLHGIDNVIEASAQKQITDNILTKNSDGILEFKYSQLV